MVSGRGIDVFPLTDLYETAAEQTDKSTDHFEKRLEHQLTPLRSSVGLLCRITPLFRWVRYVRSILVQSPCRALFRGLVLLPNAYR